MNKLLNLGLKGFASKDCLLLPQKYKSCGKKYLENEMPGHESEKLEKKTSSF